MDKSYACQMEQKVKLCDPVNKHGDFVHHKRNQL